MGEAAWAQLTPDERTAIVRDRALIEADAGAFAAYEPSLPTAGAVPFDRSGSAEAGGPGPW